MNDVINIYGIILHLVKGQQESTCGRGLARSVTQERRKSAPGSAFGASILIEY